MPTGDILVVKGTSNICVFEHGKPAIAGFQHIPGCVHRKVKGFIIGSLTDKRTRRHAGRHLRVASITVTSILINLVMRTSFECLFKFLYNIKIIGGNPRTNGAFRYFGGIISRKCFGIECRTFELLTIRRTITRRSFNKIFASSISTVRETVQCYSKRHLSVYISIFRSDCNI